MTDDTNAQAAAAEPRKIEGIGGWLILPILNVVVCVGVLAILVVMQLPDIIAPPPGYWGKDVFASGQFFSYGFVLFSTALAAFGIYCLVRLFQKKTQTPRLMIAFLLLWVIWAIGNAAGLWFFGSDQELDAGMNDALRNVGQSILPTIIWVWYFRVSVRVKNTFVR